MDEEDVSERTHQMCPDCAEVIRKYARVCRFCGYDLIREERAESLRGGPQVVTLAKSGGLAAVLSFFFPGVGQLYCGFIERGIAIMLTPLLLVISIFFVGFAGNFDARRISPGYFILGTVVYFGIYIWQMIDAYRCAERANKAARDAFS